MSSEAFPLYIQCGTHTTMRRVAVRKQGLRKIGYYYRDNGDWWLKVVRHNGNFVPMFNEGPTNHINDTKCLSITKETWAEENAEMSRARKALVYELEQGLQYGYLKPSREETL